jgi:FkbM family methyltransferase
MIETTRAYGLNFLVSVHDTGVSACLRTYGEYARPEIDLLCEACALTGSAGTMIDAGANIGAICLPVAARMPNVRVLAFEANRPFHALLAANVINNKLHQIEAIHAALGSVERIVRFPTCPIDYDGPHGQLSDAARGLPFEPVRMTTIDAVAPPDTKLIKIDVEGAELDVLHGAEQTLRSVRPLLLVEVKVHLRARSEAVIGVLSAAAYRLFWFISPFVTKLAPKRPFEDSPSFDLSVLALRDDVSLPTWAVDPIDPANPWRNGEFRIPYLEKYGHHGRARIPDRMMRSAGLRA